MGERWKVDAPGERARIYSALDRAAARAVELGRAIAPVPVTVEEVGGWAAFAVIREGGTVRLAGRFTHGQRLALEAEERGGDHADF